MLQMHCAKNRSVLSAANESPRIRHCFAITGSKLCDVGTFRMCLKHVALGRFRESMCCKVGITMRAAKRLMSSESSSRAESNGRNLSNCVKLQQGSGGSIGSTARSRHMERTAANRSGSSLVSCELRNSVLGCFLPNLPVKQAAATKSIGAYTASEGLYLMDQADASIIERRRKNLAEINEQGLPQGTCPERYDRAVI